MIVVDTSALLAVLQGEPEAPSFNEAIDGADACLLSAASYAETFIVVETRYGADGSRDLALYLHEAAITIVPVDRDQADIARQAYLAYGRGRHPAGLNFGDCFAYALAKLHGVPLLFKGEDFSRTDLVAA